jgi:hypothetical protein
MEAYRFSLAQTQSAKLRAPHSSIKYTYTTIIIGVMIQLGALLYATSRTSSPLCAAGQGSFYFIL